MGNTIPFPTARVDAPAEAPRPVAEPAPAPQPPAAVDRGPPTRLTIEEVDGRFIYTVLDRESGRVLAQIPREHVERLAEAEGYAAGAVVDTEA